MLSVLCLFAVVGFVAAEEKADKAGTTVQGKFKEWRGNILTLSVDGKDQTFRVLDDTKVQMRDGADKKEVLAKIAFATLKPDTPVTIKLDANKQVQEISVDLKK
jgi:hypothetical protein